VLGVRPSGASGYHTIPPHVVNDLGWNPANLKVVRDGMVDVVNSPNGTGKLAYIPTAVVAGKTGTAEYGRKGEGHKYGWMIAFAPADHPRYAIAMVMDEAVSGGATVAPRMKILLNGLFSAAAGKGAG